MAPHEARQTIEIEAPAEVAFEALTDYDRLAEWQSAIDELEVTEHHPDGMGEVVSYVVDVKVRKVRYSLRYTYEPPWLIRFKLVEGDIPDIEGSYEFEPDGDGRCKVTATIAVDPGVAVPAPIRRLLAGQMLKRTLHELRKRSEEIAGS